MIRALLIAAWYGDLDFVPDVKDFIARGAVDAVVTYGEPVAVSSGSDRKALTRRLEGAVRSSVAAALLGRPPAARTAG